MGINISGISMEFVEIMYGRLDYEIGILCNYNSEPKLIYGNCIYVFYILSIKLRIPF